MSRDHLTSALYPRHGARRDSLRVYGVLIERYRRTLHLLNLMPSPEAGAASPVPWTTPAQLPSAAQGR